MNRKTTRIVVPAVILTGITAAALITALPEQTSLAQPAYPSTSPTMPPVTVAPAPTITSSGSPAPSVAPVVGPLGLLRVDYTFERQGRSASNQFAIWIETESGQYVDTIFATSWIANGGWTRRPMSMPEWRESSNWANASQQQIESASRPAPRTGAQTVYWDGLDSNGQPVPAGQYVLRVEGNVEWERMVAFDAPFTIGDTPADITADETRNDRPQDTMLTGVTASWLPGEEMTPDTTTEFTRGS